MVYFNIYKSVQGSYFKAGFNKNNKQYLGILNYFHYSRSCIVKILSPSNLHKNRINFQRQK